MRVYIVMEDNGETYEDYREYVRGAYSTREKAIKAIKNAGFEFAEGYRAWSRPRYYFDGTIETYESAWIIEREVDA